MKKYFFDDDWKNWIWSNIKNGVSKQRIYNDLVANDYDVFTIINELKFIPDVLRKLDAISSTRVVGYLQAANALKIDAPFPLFVLPDFLCAAECQTLIEIQKMENTPSTTGNDKDRQINEIRTSFTTYFETLQSDSAHTATQLLKQKILSLMGIPFQYAEKIQGQWYKENGFYGEHVDAYDNYNQFKNLSGNRTWTCMITLNQVEEGGDTYFPRIDKRFKPKPGQALIWYNLNEYGLANPLTRHAGEPVIKGEKFIVTQWFAQASSNPV
ncbi:MAG: prolyl hydroxylase family protein [Gammaproteobacteria bacterium]